jgi:ribosomal protein S12 methylthiotransferase
MDALKAEIPEVDRYFGVHSIPEILEQVGLKYRKDLEVRRSITTPSHYAYLKVSEGCDRTCAFCAIPSIRGKYISRPLDEIVTEARILAGAGVRELILIAQDLSYYGLDLYRKQMLPGLVRKLLDIRELEWIRLHYLYPANFPEDLIPLIAGNPRICRYIDIPIQHISDRMLSIMRRSHGKDETISILNRLRGEIPGSVIRTTLIAGHPGETEEDYEELKQFVKDFRFDRLGVFAYSHEEGTHSYSNFTDDVPEDVKQSRVSELMEIQQEISAEHNRKYTGQEMRVLIDRREGDYFAGRTEFDSPEVDQEVLIPAEYNLKPGSFCRVLITHSTEFDLFASPVTEA